MASDPHVEQKGDRAQIDMRGIGIVWKAASRRFQSTMFSSSSHPDDSDFENPAQMIAEPEVPETDLLGGPLDWSDIQVTGSSLAARHINASLARSTDS